MLNPRTGRIRNLTTGEPEPTNLATTFFGDVYWTCKSAGVILTFEDGAEKLVANNLIKPTGLAAYPLGVALFYTEVPTPGVNGGKNKVSKLTLKTGKITVIDAGDPDPINVAAHPDGTVYWTCRSAGVIVEATPKRR